MDRDDIVSLKGEEKSRKQQRCYYGAMVCCRRSSSMHRRHPPRSMASRKIIANKTAELTDYVAERGESGKSYLPRTLRRFRRRRRPVRSLSTCSNPASALGSTSATTKKPGDSLGIQIDLANNRVLGLTVSTYLNSRRTLSCWIWSWDSWTDGTIYASDTKLNAQAKDLTVTAQNSGYAKRTERPAITATWSQAQ